MAFAIKSEMSALSFLFRGLSIRKQCSDIAKVRQISCLPFCIPQKNSLTQRSLYTVFQNSETRLPQSHRQDVVCSATGTYLQQHRSYAKAAKVGSGPTKKLSFDYSGDLMTLKSLDPTQTHTDFRHLTELKGASESIQKLCSVDFASGTEKKIHRVEEMRERILHLFGPDADREMQVAVLTVDIRNMIQHVLTCRKDKLNKSRLVEKIQLRKKMLKYLRRSDYQRFLWLLKELQIRYVLPPDYHKRNTRKYRRKQRVWDAANNLRLKKIAALKAQLEAEKSDFLKYKEDTLKQIEEDAKYYNLDLTDFDKLLKRERVGKTYPKILTWEERLQLPDDHPLKPKNVD